MLFQGGLSAEKYWSLALIGLSSILTLIYTFRAFQRIWWQQPGKGIYTKPSGDQIFAPAALIVVVLLLGIWADPLVNFAIKASNWLANPASYWVMVLGG